MKNPASGQRGSQLGVPTVAEVCERHIATRKDPRTAAAYRSRLRPVTARYGDLSASEALAVLGEVERELAAEYGDRGAHKAVTLLKAGLRDAGFELLTLIAAAKGHKIALASLRDLVDRDLVRCRSRRRHGRGESILFDARELAEDLAGLLPCRADDCEHPGTGPSGYCGQHGGQAGRERAAEAEQDLLASKTSFQKEVLGGRRMLGVDDITLTGGG